MTLPTAPQGGIPFVDQDRTLSNSGLIFLQQLRSSIVNITGGGGAAFPLLGPNGSVSAPSYSWASETNSGWYRASLNDIRFSVNGVDVIRCLPATVDIGSLLYPSTGVFRYDVNSALAANTVGAKNALFGFTSQDSNVTWLNGYLPGVDAKGEVTTYSIHPAGIWANVNACRSSDNVQTPPQDVISNINVVVQDNTSQAQFTWAGYDAGHITAGAAVSHMIGREISIFNSGTVVVEDPYNVNPSGSSVGLRVDSSMDGTGGGNNVSAAIDIINNGAKFLAGIVIQNNSIVAGGGAGGSTPAMALPVTYQIVWYSAAGTALGSIGVDGSGNMSLQATGSLKFNGTTITVP